MTPNPPPLVAGEQIDDLLEGLQKLKIRRRADGSGFGTGVVTPPLIRAMMRMEAKLLVDDAEAIARGDAVDRTPPQRRHDALLEILRTLAALRECA